MKRLLIVSVSVVIALAAVAITALAMGSDPSVVAVPAQGTAQLAAVHLAPFAPGPSTAVTVTLDGTPILTDFAFADSTDYLPVPAGTHLVEIYPAGSSSPALTKTIDLQEDFDYTAIAVGGANTWDLDLALLMDDNTPPAAGNAKVRIGHLAPFTPTIDATRVDVRLQDGTIILDDVNYGLVTWYAPQPAGPQDLKVTTPDGSTTLIDPMPVDLNDGDIVSFFAIGDGRNQPLGVFALPSDQPGFLLPLSPRLAIAHLAPFAADPSPSTAVTVTLDSTPILTDFAFADSTGYLWVPTGTHLVEIYPAGSSSPALTKTITLQEDIDYTAIAVGGANSWDLELAVLMDDNTPPAAGNAKIRIGHLAPFTSTIDATRVDVRLQDGTIILDDINYGLVTWYAPQPAGPHDLKVTTPDGSTTLIDPVSVDLNDGDIVSFFAVGDGDNQPLGAFALPSDQPGYLLPLTKYVYLPLVVRGFGP